MTATHRTIEAAGLRFAYLEEGEGPLVLLFHGFPDTAYTWDHVAPRIAQKGYRAVSVFMRGYHPTEVPDRDPDAEVLAKDPLALIDAFGAKDAILVGHDWGCACVYGAAALAPERVKKVFAVGIPHPATLVPRLSQVWGVRHFLLYKLPGAHRRFAANDFAALPQIYARWSPTWSPPPEELAHVREVFSHPASLEAAFGYYRALRFVPAPFLRKPTTVPTVAFAGTDDPNVTPDEYRAAKRMFAGEYVVEAVPGGHFMHREHPEVFAERLLAHL